MVILKTYFYRLSNSSIIVCLCLFLRFNALKIAYRFRAMIYSKNKNTIGLEPIVFIATITLIQSLRYNKLLIFGI